MDMTEDDRLAVILADHAGREGALLPILHDVQAAYDCVPADCYQPIADALRLSRAEVAGAGNESRGNEGRCDP